MDNESCKSCKDCKWFETVSNIHVCWLPFKYGGSIHTVSVVHKDDPPCLHIEPKDKKKFDLKG